MEKQGMISKIKSLFGQKEESGDVRDAISELIAEDEVEEDSSLNQEERGLFSNILDLQKLTVEDIMVPRADIVAVSLDTKQQDLMNLIDSAKFSRFPVYHETMDDIRGFVHIKDILLNDTNKVFDLRSYVHRTIYVPTSMPVIDLLSKMRAEKTPIAIVVDEYGGTDGLITAWDILLEILGEMNQNLNGDDHAKFVENEDGSYTVDARFDIEELEDNLDDTLLTAEMREEVDTIGGLVMYIAGRVPERKEIIAYEDGYEFEVTEATPRSIIEVRITKKNLKDASD